MIQQAYRFALDPTPGQARILASHAGGARFAYNWGNAVIIAALDARQAQKDAGEEPSVRVPSHFDLCKQWTAWKNEHADDPDPAEGERRTNTAWVGDNFVGTYQAALRDVTRAWSDFFKSAKGERKGRRRGRPRFKKKGKCRESFQVHGERLRMADARHVTLPKIGTIAVISDDSLHPAMRRSRDRASPPPAERAMKSARRRVELAQRKLAKTRERHAEAIRAAESQPPGPAAGAWGPEPRQARQRAEWTARGVAKAEKALTSAERDLSAAAARQQDAAVFTPNRQRHMGNRRRAAHLCRMLRRHGDARLVRATLSLGADGLWWCSVTAAIPHQARTSPSRAQREGGLIGVDFGVREVATASNGVTITNPRHLQVALAELRSAQKRLSRCPAGSKRREKARRRVGLIHADIARLREASLHRATTALVRQHDVIAIEGWDVQQVMHNGSKDTPRRLRRDRNRALADTGVGMGRKMLIYKGQRAGVTVMVAGPHARTGRTCSVDGKARTTPLPPRQQMFTSDQCAHITPRRENTAKALAAWARKELNLGPSPGGPAQPRGGDVRPGNARKGGAGRSPVKRAASSGPGPGETGNPGGQLPGIPEPPS